MDKSIIYKRFGKQYIKLKRNEVIKEGAVQSWCDGDLQPIMHSDNETIGDIPSNFSDSRDFYNPIDLTIKKESNVKLIIVIGGLVLTMLLTVFNMTYNIQIATSKIEEYKLDNESQEIYEGLIYNYKTQIKNLEDMNKMIEEISRRQLNIIRAHGLEQELIDAM
jgi:hypothetical protein